MPRSTNASHAVATPASRVSSPAKACAPMSDAERAERGRAQIAAGQCLDDDGLDAFLDSLQIPTSKA